MLIRSTLLATLLFAPTLLHAESYICTPTASTGFSYNEFSKKWDSTSFKAGNNFILKPAIKKNNFYTYELTDMGSKKPKLLCTRDIDEYGFLHCPTFFGIFKFDKNSLRFLNVYTAGYWTGKDNNENTPNIEIGKCVQIE